MNEENLSVEQMCRDLLTQALADGLVGASMADWDDPDPQARSAGELCGMANLLSKFLASEKQEE